MTIVVGVRLPEPGAPCDAILKMQGGQSGWNTSGGAVIGDGTIKIVFCCKAFSGYNGRTLHAAGRAE